MNESENPWKTLRTELKYENPWIKVTESQVLNPSGNPGIYGKVHFKNTAIGIIPLDNELNTWLVGQYRYVLNQYSWEIPEGGGKLGIPPLESAKRELLEETGIVATQWDHIMDVHLSNSVSDELGLIYIARNLRFEEACPEDNEQLRVKKLPFSEVVEMVLRGEITDALAVSGILKANVLLSNNRL